MSEFKVGDRVRFVECPNGFNVDTVGHKGQEGVIFRELEDPLYKTRLRFDDGYETGRMSLSSIRIELIETNASVDPIIDPVFKVGDRVRLVKTKSGAGMERKGCVGEIGTVRKLHPNSSMIDVYFESVKYNSGPFAPTNPEYELELMTLTITPHDADILGDLLNLGWAERERDDNAVILVDASEAVAVLLQVYTGAPVEHGPTIKVAHLQHQEAYNWPRVLDLPSPEEAVVYWQKVRDTYAEGNQIDAKDL